MATNFNADILRLIVPRLKVQADYLAGVLGPAMLEAEIDTVKRQAAFIAQLAHETCGFKWLSELGNIAYFDRYEGRVDLGNMEAGDGRRYRGRGFIMITGRANYARAGKALGIDLIAYPEMAEKAEVAAKIATWYWTEHGLNADADAGAFKLITRKINGGLNGYADRLAYYKRALEYLEDIEGESEPEVVVPMSEPRPEPKPEVIEYEPFAAFSLLRAVGKFIYWLAAGRGK